MKIAMVSEHASPLAVLGGVDAGGQNVHVADLARALARRGAEVVVHTRRDDPSLPPTAPLAPGVTVDHVPAGPAAPVPKDELLPMMGDFADHLADRWGVAPPDVVHSHFWMSGLAGLRAAQPLGVPLAHTYHALGTVKRRHQGAADTSPPERIATERWVAQQADCVVATTADEVRELQDLTGGDLAHRVIPCGVDLERFCPDGPRWARGGRRLRVVVVSRLVERKGIGNVIAAVASRPDWELLIAGGPPAAMVDDDPEALRFVELADRLGAADRVELLGSLGREEVPALLRSADVVACCPWYEPFGLVAVEAMACGVPVVASRVGGLAETVVHGRTGLHVNPRCPGEIAAALDALAASRRCRSRLGAAGALRSQRYGWDRIAREHLEVAAALTGRRTGVSNP